MCCLRAQLAVRATGEMRFRATDSCASHVSGWLARVTSEARARAARDSGASENTMGQQSKQLRFSLPSLGTRFSQKTMRIRETLAAQTLQSTARLSVESGRRHNQAIHPEEHATVLILLWSTALSQKPRTLLGRSVLLSLRNYAVEATPSNSCLPALPHSPLIPAFIPNCQSEHHHLPVS